MVMLSGDIQPRGGWTHVIEHVTILYSQWLLIEICAYEIGVQEYTTK